MERVVGEGGTGGRAGTDGRGKEPEQEGSVRRWDGRRLYMEGVRNKGKTMYDRKEDRRERT